MVEAVPSPDFDIARASVLDSVPHGFFGTGGGVHQFGYGGPGDPDAVRSLRQAAARALVPDAALAMPHQVHSPDVVTVTEPWGDPVEARPVADALVTARKGMAIGIVTADCGPVLFADAQAGVIGAAHAGWRGAHGGVLENTIAAMERLGAQRSRISAALGPTISQASYEVDARFRENFTDADAIFFCDSEAKEGTPRWKFDLPAYIVSRLKSAGLSQVQDLAADTLTSSGRYFSYRLATQSGAQNYGRQISLIALAR
ncbi:MAG: peptidoglycan editing factor PgeF [Pseudomonadota bacterium]|nr:peptidoglycan editing factor PgeF [Pseudomonadota bacterium]